MSWSPQPDKKTTPISTTSVSTTPKVLFSPLTVKRRKSYCIKRASTGQVQLAVVKLKIEANGHSFITYALVDPGSELSLMSHQALRALKLNPPTEELLMGTLHGDALMAVQRADVTISSLDNSFSFVALELPAIKGFNLHPGTVDWPKKKFDYPHLADLDLHPIDFSKVTIFLGSGYQEALETRKPIPV